MFYLLIFQVTMSTVLTPAVLFLIIVFLVSCPRSSFNNFSDSGLFVLSGAKDLYVPNYQTVGAIFARWLSIKMTATATFLETFFCKELLGHDTSPFCIIGESI